MEIVYKRLDEIYPYENNPRNNDEAVSAVANSIKAFGFKVPIVIDRDGIIVAGHTRYKAAKALKLDKVPCVEAEKLSENEAKEFRIVDNKTAELAGWKMNPLTEELRELCDFNMEQFGFGAVDKPEETSEETDKDKDKKDPDMVVCPHCGMLVEKKKVRISYEEQ